MFGDRITGFPPVNVAVCATADSTDALLGSVSKMNQPALTAAGAIPVSTTELGPLLVLGHGPSTVPKVALRQHRSPGR